MPDLIRDTEPHKELCETILGLLEDIGGEAERRPWLVMPALRALPLPTLERLGQALAALALKLSAEMERLGQDDSKLPKFKDD